jgi:uncharacterized protein with PQ loop repeat
MQEDPGFRHSFSGFVDFSKCYPIPSPAWLFIGSSVALGAMISTVPQVVRIVRLRSNFGLNWMYVTLTTIGQFILVYNVVCLHAADFIGILQVPLHITIPRFLTFFITFFLWFGYLPIAMLSCIFIEINGRSHNTKTNELRAHSVLGIVIGVPLLLIVVNTVFIRVLGFASTVALDYGRTLGTIAAFLVIFQYVPQMITTCKLKDPGSLSIGLMAIQAPGGTGNALFMWLGQGDSWTTWLSILSASVQMWILLGISVFFKLRNRRKAQVLDQPSDVESASVGLLGQDEAFADMTRYLTERTGSQGSRTLPEHAGLLPADGI